MTRPNLRLFGCTVALLLLAAGSARAQNRTAQITAAQQAYDGFDPARAAQLLRVALNPNPANGPTDANWARGVQLLIQILLEDKKDSLANVWARWAVRLSPGLQVDSVTFLPQVVTTIRNARTLVAARPGTGESLTRTTWDWDWPSAGVRDPMGGVRPGAATVPTGARVLVVGVGLLTPGQTLPLNPGTYDVQATADGYVSARVSREILPGATTIMDFSLQTNAQAQAALLAAETLPDDVRARSLRGMVRLSVKRFGMDATCTAGAAVSSDGLVLTTYQAIRGADAVEAQFADGAPVRTGITVAAYDVRRNLAVLKMQLTRPDSLLASQDVSDGDFGWGLAYPGCQAATFARTRIGSWTDRPNGSLQLSDTLALAAQGGPVINRSGNVIALGSTSRTAVPGLHAADIVGQARSNVTANRTSTLADVGRRENHLFGSLLIRSSASGAQVRVTPGEPSLWPELAKQGPAPLTFAGPAGRYQIALLVGGQVNQQTTATIIAGAQTPVSIDATVAQGGAVPGLPAKKGKSKAPIFIAGGGGAAALAVVLLLPKKTPPVITDTATTGSISIHLPVQ